MRALISKLSVAVLLITGGCSDAEPEEEGPPNGTPPPMAGPVERIPNTTCRFDGRAPLAGAFALEPAFGGATYARPVDLVAAPDGTERAFVVEQAGRIYAVNTTTEEQTLFIDLSDRVSRNGNEEGLLGLAFHPEFLTNGEFFVHYSARSPRRGVIARFRTSAEGAALPESEEVLLEVAQPFGNHNGGKIAFGPDAYLYIALGDGGAGGDPLGHGQNLSTLLGTILRIDIDRTQDTLAYGIPADNPFVGVAEARDEIWAYGLRNPWRFSFDRATGDLWAGDVGQGDIEEIDLITRGGNYGWKVMEGSECFEAAGCDDTGMTPPVVEYRQDGELCSVTGGFVYRGGALPELYGAYIYGDYCTGTVWAFWWDGQAATRQQLLLESGLRLAAFGEDRDGEVYLLGLGGQILGLAPNDGANTSAFPQTLEDTGCYADVSTQEPIAAAIPYSVNAELWSDGAVKRRYMVLPGDDKVAFAETGAWDFPRGSVLIKEFYAPAVDGGAGVPLETRFLVREEHGWRGHTYQFNEEGTDGALLHAQAVVNTEAPNFTHTIPSPSRCSRCHASEAGGALGLHTGQLDRQHRYSDGLAPQLAVLDRLGIFTTPLDLAAERVAFPPPEDTESPLGLRARSYLQSNCAGCHLPEGPTNTALDLRFETDFVDMNACNEPPTKEDLGIQGARLLVPGDPERSLLYRRIAVRGEGQMPPLGSDRVDTDGADLIRSWIASLESCP